MASFNLRLTPEDAEAVKALRRDNVNVSELLRTAIHSARRKHRPKKAIWTKAKVDELIAKVDAIQAGLKPDWIEQGLDVTDRRQMAAYLRKRSRRRLGKLTDL